MRIHVGRPTGRRLAWIALALAVGLTLTAAGALATPGNGHGKGLGKGDTALVAAAKAQGKSTVPLLIATKPGDTAAVASKLAGFGATVTDQSDRFGYLVVDVPTDKAIQAAKTVGILAANVDKALPAVVPTLGEGKGWRRDASSRQSRSAERVHADVPDRRPAVRRGASDV